MFDAPTFHYMRNFIAMSNVTTISTFLLSRRGLWPKYFSEKTFFVLHSKIKYQNDSNHKETFTRMIYRLENRQYEISEDYYYTNGTLPDEFDYYKPEIHNEESLGIKIEHWSDLEIWISMDKVTFRKISLSRTNNDFLIFCKIKNPYPLEI